MTLELCTHTDAVSVPGWSGAGYIIYDPVTGDGAYKIGGGANGAWLIVFVGLLLVALSLHAIIALGPLGLIFAGMNLFDLIQLISTINSSDSFEDQCNIEFQAGIATMFALMFEVPVFLTAGSIYF